MMTIYDRFKLREELLGDYTIADHMQERPMFADHIHHHIQSGSNRPMMRAAPLAPYSAAVHDLVLLTFTVYCPYAVRSQEGSPTAITLTNISTRTYSPLS